MTRWEIATVTWIAFLIFAALAVLFGPHNLPPGKTWLDVVDVAVSAVAAIATAAAAIIALYLGWHQAASRRAEAFNSTLIAGAAIKAQLANLISACRDSDIPALRIRLSLLERTAVQLEQIQPSLLTRQNVVCYIRLSNVAGLAIGLAKEVLTTGRVRTDELASRLDDLRTESHVATWKMHGDDFPIPPLESVEEYLSGATTHEPRFP